MGRRQVIVVKLRLLMLLSQSSMLDKQGNQRAYKILNLSPHNGGKESEKADMKISLKKPNEYKELYN